MSLDGLRAWIGEVERKLGMRTRVFLVLTVIAIGIGGAAVYLAIDARDSSVSESDVQALQEQLEARIGEGGGPAAGVEPAQLEAELKTLQAEVAELKEEGSKSQSEKGTSNGTGGASSGGGGGGASDSSGGDNGVSGSGGDNGTAGEAGGEAPGGGVDSARLQELLDEAAQRNAEAEEEESEK